MLTWRYTVRLLVCLAFLFATSSMLLDNYSTYLALSQYPLQTYEHNPIFREVFGAVGLQWGIMLNVLVCMGAYIFLAGPWMRLAASTRTLILVLLGTIRFSAWTNNLAVISLITLQGGS